MDLLQVGSSAAFLVALEDFDVVLEVELFEEPDDALGTRLLEPGWCCQRTLFGRRGVGMQCWKTLDVLQARMVKVSRATHQ